MQKEAFAASHAVSGAVEPPVVAALTGGIEVLNQCAQEWRELCDEGWNDYPFCRPEWLYEYGRAFEPAARVMLLAARTGGKIRALLPLVSERAFLCGVPVRRLRGASSGWGFRFDLVRAHGEEGDEAVRAIWHFLRECRDWDVLQFSSVPEPAALRQLLSEAERDGFPTGCRPSYRTPYIPLAGLSAGKDPWLARTSANFRSIVRRRTRQLTERGRLELCRVDGAVPEAIERYYELELSTWKGERGCAIPSDRRTRQFYDAIIHSAAQAGFLSFYFLELNGSTVAGQLGLTYRHKYFWLRCAFNRDYYQYSPGHVLVNWVLRDCVARGIQEYDFVGEAHDWKCKWTSTHRPHDYCFVFRPGLVGHTLHTMKFALIPWARKLLGRRLPEQ